MSTRRAFLAHTAAGTLLSLGLPAPTFWQQVARATPPRKDLPILVVIELTGGNDGLNTVVPYANDLYHKSRPTLGIKADKVLKLNDQVGLHPAMTELHQLWEAGQVKIVQGVGYPNPNRSHFRSMEIWHTGVLGPTPTEGWLGRIAEKETTLGRCHVGNEAVPLALQGRKEPVPSIPSLAEYRLREGAILPPAGSSSGAAVLEEIAKRINQTRALSQRFALAPDRPTSPAPTSLEERLTTIKALIESVPGFRIYYTAHSGFDTHAGQQFVHQDLLRTLAGAVRRFMSQLHQDHLDDQVVILVFSEFGRRVRENGQAGTDHGTAAPVFLIGKPVQGGLLGPAPNLAQLDMGDLRFRIDFRDVYATLIRQWLRVDPAPVLGQRDETLALLR